MMDLFYKNFASWIVFISQSVDKKTKFETSIELFKCFSFFHDLLIRIERFYTSIELFKL